MTPFDAKPGETIVGLGLDFRTRLADSETIAAAPTVVSDIAGLTISGQGYSGTIAVATVSIPVNQADGTVVLTYVVTGTAGNVRKGYRTIEVCSSIAGFR